MNLFSEKRMVRKATPRILEALRLVQKQCKIAHELTVGYSIADIVILRANITRPFWPEGPLSVAESAILSSLRRLGTANVDAIAREVFMRAEPVRRLLLGRLSSWYLVQNYDGEFKTAKAWVSQSEIIAIEAKLTRWRDAIAQAAAYRRYADRTFVLLPMQNAVIAAQHKAAFAEAGVGLLSYGDGRVVRVFPARKAKEHTWHREFAISRLR
jgi:hypothetical protein